MTRRKQSNIKIRNATSFTKRENKEKGKIMNWITLFVAIFGAFGGLASVKMIVNHFTPGEIKGKMISRYVNLNKDNTQTFFLYKISILSQSKSFNLRKIKCEIEDPNSNKFFASATNKRQIVFIGPKPQNLKKQINNYQENLQLIHHQLLISGDEFLNNSSFFPMNENIVGYLFFVFEGDLNFKCHSTTFIFESFDGKTKKLKIEEKDIKPEDLFYDDTIWKPIDNEEMD